MALDQNIGMVTAYAYAVSKGYTGTEEQFAQELASAGADLSQIQTQIDNFINTIVPAKTAEVTAEGTRQIGLVAAEGTAQKNAVTAEGTTQKNAVISEGTTQKNAVNSAGSTQVNAVNSAGSTQVGNVNTAGSTQVGAVQAKGQEVINSIPSDYTALSDDVDDLKNAVNDDESVIGVHRSQILKSHTPLVAYSIPQGTTITIYTVNGENLPENRLLIYDSEGTYIDYFVLTSTYGNSRTVLYNKMDAGYIALNSAYSNGIKVVYYDTQTLGQDVASLNQTVSTHTQQIAENSQIIDNGYYNYSSWDNCSWSRNNSGNRYPAKYSNAKRVSFSALLFVRAGAKIHIEGYSGRKYGRNAWTYDASTEMYTNTVWDTSWLTNSMDWVLTEDSYINVAVANTDDTTTIAIEDIKVIVSIYDSYFSQLERRIDNADVVIPSRFSTEMSTSLASVRNVMTEPCLVFPLITDIHYSPNSNVFQNFDDTITLMRKLSEEIPCDLVANMGDNINGSSNQSLMLRYAYYMLSQFHKIGLPYTFCIGNHDTNYDPGEKFTIGETFSAFFAGTKGVVYNEATNGTDFYKDIPNLGIRVVSLNTQYLNAYVISPDSVSWFTNTALNTNYMVILLTHQALIPNQAWSNRVPTNSADIVSAIQTFINNGGTLVQLFGHAHADYAFTTPWLAIGSTCGKFEQADTTAAGYQAITGYTGTLTSPARVVGTATEQAWNVVVFKPLSRKVNVIRFGAGDDREFTF